MLSMSWNSFWSGLTSLATEPQPTRKTNVVEKQKPTNRTIQSILVSSDGKVVNAFDINVDKTPFEVGNVLFDNSKCHFRPASTSAYVSFPLSGKSSHHPLVLWYNCESTEEKNECASALCNQSIHGPVLFTGNTNDAGLYTSVTREQVEELLETTRVVKEDKQEELDLAPQFEAKKKKEKRSPKTKVKRTRFKDPPKIKTKRQSKRIATRRKNGQVKSFH